MTESQKLLAEYVANGSEAAFRELVARYFDLVYSTAVRLVAGDAHLAEDVTQNVFINLARKAGGIADSRMLGGWLHRDACFAAGKIMRKERRRAFRERQALAMHQIEDYSEANLAQVAPVLDDAINQLGAEDRAAILLRFFEQRTLRAVGEALGSSENAAQKRIARALEELRGLLKRRGVALSAAALGTVLAAGVVKAAPAGLAASISGAAFAVGSTANGSTLAFLKFMATTKLKMSVAAVVIAASVLTPLLVQRQAAAKIREQNVQITQQKERLEQLQAAAENVAPGLARATDAASELPATDRRELLKLRAEVGQLRDRAQTLQKIAAFREEMAPLSYAEAWTARANHLKAWLEEHPSEKAPELGAMPARLWINSIYPIAVETDDECRRAMSIVRENAEGPTRNSLEAGLSRYAAANGGQFPADLSQINQYLSSPIDPAILQRYTIVPVDGLAPELRPAGENEVITEVSPVNAADDCRHALGIKNSMMANQSVINRWTFAP